MRFSVIVPAYNVENYIRKALDSIKNQSFTDYECIVICDSCVDKTEDIVKEYPFISCSEQFNNAGLARNVALDMAQGDYILFLDADDWYLHEFVFQQINDKLTDEDMLCCAFIWKNIGYAEAMSNKGLLYPHVWNKCWKRSFIANTRFSAVEVEDAVFHDEMMQKNPKIVMWNMPIVYYNFLRDGSSSQRLERTVEGTIEGWEIR